MLTDDGKHLYVSWDEYHQLIERPGRLHQPSLEICAGLSEAGVKPKSAWR
ncbi:hypothetical protein SAMN05421778_1152 [Sphaerotilus natans]|nr:hypothetical protein SAMN05421778_1152 [Sphaerotilus natans]